MLPVSRISGLNAKKRAVLKEEVLKEEVLKEEVLKAEVKDSTSYISIAFLKTLHFKAKSRHSYQKTG